MLKQTPKILLAALLAVGIGSGQSGATTENLNLNEMAALLVLPIVTGGQPANIESSTGDVIIETQRAHTLVTVTNGLSANGLLLIDVISGDIGDDAWDTDSFDCYVTGRETTTFVFSPAGPGHSSMHVECGEVAKFNNQVVDVETEGEEIRATTGAQNGFIVIAAASAASGMAVGANAIFGDAIVVDPNGQAYSFGAISFQAGKATNDGDKNYMFGLEYANLPSVLVSNFVAEGPDNDVNAELILLTLDGTTGSNFTPNVSLRGHVWDDDENDRNFTYDFDCFDIVPLSEISDGFIFDPNNSLNLGSPTGHFDLATRNSGTDSSDPHDSNWGDGNGIRNRGAHGWIVQNVDGVLLEGDQPITGVAAISTSDEAAWGRPLLQSTTAMVGAGVQDKCVRGDYPTLAADDDPGARVWGVCDDNSAE